MNETALDVAARLGRILAEHAPHDNDYKVAIFVFRELPFDDIDIGFISEVEETTLRKWLRLWLRPRKPVTVQ